MYTPICHTPPDFQCSNVFELIFANQRLKFAQIIVNDNTKEGTLSPFCYRSYSRSRIIRGKRALEYDLLGAKVRAILYPTLQGNPFPVVLPDKKADVMLQRPTSGCLPWTTYYDWSILTGPLSLHDLGPNCYILSTSNSSVIHKLTTWAPLP